MFTSLTYLLPMVQMLISYSHMSFVLWSKTLSEGTVAGSIHRRETNGVARQVEKSISNKRKVRVALSQACFIGVQ